MPRGRCHWAALVRTREALRGALPPVYDLVRVHRGEFFAGGVAPDAIRLFAGADKLSSHFYDDRRPDTWACIVDTVAGAHPDVAVPERLSSPARAWMAGYLVHILTDIAYWRNVLSRLPPFPDHMAVHHGAWMLADQAPVPPDERSIDVAAIRFEDAPAWVEEAAVRRLLSRLTERMLPPEGVWQIELAYYRNRPDTQGASDEELLAKHLPQWEESLALAAAALPDAVWAEFHDDAIRGAVDALRQYFGS